MGNVVPKVRAAGTVQLIVLLLAALIVIMAFSGDSKGRSGTTDLEVRIGSTLSEMEGVGKVRVVIRTRMQSVQSNSFSSQNHGEEVPCGVIAVAEKANDPVVRMKLIHALCALLGLDAAEVEVVSMKGAR